MPDYTQFFLGAKRSVVELECLEILHPSFSKTYRIVRNAIDGLVATDENGVSRVYDYYPLRIGRNTIKDDLDNGIKIDLGDVGDITGVEIQAARSAGTLTTKPTIKYRIYRSDDLSAPMDGPYVYEAKSFSLTQNGCSFEAKAREMNLNSTGQLYKIETFPMLVGFL